MTISFKKRHLASKHSETGWKNPDHSGPYRDIDKVVPDSEVGSLKTATYDLVPVTNHELEVNGHPHVIRDIVLSAPRTNKQKMSMEKVLK